MMVHMKTAHSGGHEGLYCVLHLALFCSLWVRTLHVGDL